MSRICYAALVVFLFSFRAVAYPEYYNAFTTAYPFVAGTRLATCVVCHEGSNPAVGPPQSLRNPYGLSFAGQPHIFSDLNENVTALRNIENIDSDGDSFSNITEINALSFPGDPSDKPADKTPPSVSIVSPSDGTSFSSPQTVSIQASASDNVGVTRVEFYDNGNLRGTITSPPYTFSWAIVGGDNGAHPWTARAYDAAGNASTSATITLNVAIDITPPTVSLISPSDGASFSSSQTIPIQANATDNIGVSRVEFYDNGNLRGTVTSPPYTFSWTITGSDNGAHPWTARAYDAAGNASSSATITLNVAIDVTPPTVSLISPSDGASFSSSQTVPIQANATDNIGVSRVEFYDNGNLRGTVTSPPYTFAWAISGGDNGAHPWTARAYDAAGNASTSATITLNVAIDVIPPTVSLTSPSDGASFSSSQTVPIQANATDNIGVSRVEFYDNGNLRGTVTSPPYTFAWAISGGDNGAHPWTARAYDAAGNVGASATIILNVNIDVIPPTVSLISPSDGASFSSPQTIPIQANASDDTGVTRVEFYDNGNLRGTVTSPPYTFSWAITGGDNGAHPWSARAYDAAGNASSSATITLNVAIDVTPPMVSLISPSDGASFSSSQTVPIQASATDNIGVTRVEFYDNGNLRGTVTSPPYTFAWAISGGDNGAHPWTARAYDAAGNVGASATITLNVNIDVIPPTVSLISPSDGASFSSPQTVPIQANAIDDTGVTRVEFYDNGNLRGTVTSPPYTFAWAISGGDNGAHPWTARAYDAAGNASSSATITLNVAIDVTPPMVSLTSPSDGASFSSSQTVPIQANATDNIGITRVEFYDNGNLRGTIASPPYTFAWTITGGDNGAHPWTARAYDAAGNVGASATITLNVNIDVIPPTVSLISPSDGASFSSPQTIPIQANASDDTGVTRVEFYDNGNLRGTIASPPYTFAWAITGADNGAHPWSARAYDAAGNASSSATITLNVAIDVTPPTVSLISPSDGASFSSPQTIPIQANATDNIGVSRVEFYDNGNLQGTVTTPPYAFAWTITGSDNGAHPWTARAYDAAGNGAISAAITLNVDISAPQPPVVSITNPSDGSVFTLPQTVTIQANATDNFGVTKVEFYDNGNLRDTVATPPYAFSWAISVSDNGAHSWTARAYNAAGSVGSSAVVNLTVNIEVSVVRLLITSGATADQISWSTSDSGYVLQQTTNLGASGSWTDLALPIVVDGLVHTVLVPLSAASLRITLQGSNPTLQWTGDGRLLEAASPLGPWADVSGSANPMSLDPAKPAAFYRLQPVGQVFYRLRHP